MWIYLLSVKNNTVKKKLMKRIILFTIITILAFSTSTALAQKKGEKKSAKKESVKKESIVEQSFVVEQSNSNKIIEQTLVKQNVAQSMVPSSNEHSIIGLMLGSGPVVLFVLAILAALSIFTWGIVISKISYIRTAKKESKEFDNIFWSSKNLSRILEVAKDLDSSPVANVYLAGHKELTEILETSEKDSQNVSNEDLNDIERALKKAKSDELNRLESGTTFLATTASAAPFIGLFGTVWGIMNAFIGLSNVKSSSIQAVAPGISEALIATAIGLAAAIPAAIFYNVLMHQVRFLSRGIDSFSAEFLNIARRHFLR